METADAGDEQISELLSGLPRVEAPGDFGFRVKAGIAEHRSARASFRWVRRAALAAAPLLLILFVGGYFAINSLYWAGGDSLPAVAVEAGPTTPQLVTPPVSAAVPESTETASAEPVPSPANRNRQVAVGTTGVRRTHKPRQSDEDKGGGSFDSALTPTKELLPTDAPRPEVSGARPAGDVLIRLGINALYSESGWKADSVTADTAAARAGVKAGDVIESVDDQTLSDRSSIAKPASGKKIRVLREGKSIDIIIEP